MKNSISNVWLLGLVIGFILIFAAYLTVTLNYSKAFKVKNEVLTIIEKKKGISTATGNTTVRSTIAPSYNVTVPNSAVGTINAYLQGTGYFAKGACDNDGAHWVGVKSLKYEDGTYDIDNPAKPGVKYYYCFSKKARANCNSGADLTMTQCHYKNIAYYYDVLFFYKLDLPILGDLFTFRVEGITGDIYNIASSSYDCTCA